MNSRFKVFGGRGSKRIPNRIGTASQQPSTTSLVPPAPTNGVGHLTPPDSTSSTTSLPMNPGQNGLGRPPSYTYPNAPRATSPMPPQPQPPHPLPINTNAYPQSHPALVGAQPPPGYGNGAPTLGQYGRGQAVEVEGAGRSKAQLIVGIDFVRNAPTLGFAH